MKSDPSIMALKQSIWMFLVSNCFNQKNYLGFCSWIAHIQIFFVLSVNV